MSDREIPFHDLRRATRTIADDVARSVARVLDRGWLLAGPEVEGFEQEFADHGGHSHVVAVANGTDALELCLRALAAGPGDEVLVAANAGGYGTIATRLVGATPVFCDVEPATLLLDVDQAVRALTPRTTAVIVTHLYGSVVDVDGLRSVLPAGVTVIEDCAQAHGATLGGHPVGTRGDLSAFSFYPTKNLGALGDAGAVATADRALADAVRQLAQYGWGPRFDAVRAGGRNSRMDEIQAAVLRHRLAQLDERNARRAAVLGRYEDALGDRLSFPVRRAGSVAHLAVGSCERRDDLRAHLDRQAIGTGVHYPVPDHHQAGLVDAGQIPPVLPVAERAAARVVSLPLYPELADDEVDTVCAAVARWGTDAG